MENKTSDPGPPPFRDNHPNDNNVITPVNHNNASVLSKSLDSASNVEHSHQSIQETENFKTSPLKSNIKKAPPYDWQLLPQDELERIAYNSRKQKKARLRENPPKCPNCPNARFTSMAMLSTHMQSKKHLARAKKQAEQNQNQGQPTLISTTSNPLQLTYLNAAKGHTADPEKKERTVDSAQGETIGSGIGSEVKPRATYAGPDNATANDSASVDMDVDTATGNIALETLGIGDSASAQDKSREQNLPETGKRSSKRRKRRAERDRKKARARLDKVSVPDSQMAVDTVPALLAEGPHVREAELSDRDIDQDIKAIQNHCTNIDPYHQSPFLPTTSQGNGISADTTKTTERKQARRPKSRMPVGSSNLVTPKGLPPDQSKSSQTSDMKLDSTNHSEINVSTTEAQAISTSNPLESTSVEGTSQSHWYCSICKVRWKKEKAWRGHLLSAQHMRHVLKTMQQLVPPIAPYGMREVQASKDPFGWGTGVGVVEEEDDEEYDDEDVRAAEHVTETSITSSTIVKESGDNSENDMDLE